MFEDYTFHAFLLFENTENKKLRWLTINPLKTRLDDIDVKTLNALNFFQASEIVLFLNEKCLDNFFQEKQILKQNASGLTTCCFMIDLFFETLKNHCVSCKKCKLK